MKTNISLPDQLHERAEQARAELGLSFDELCERALESFLRKCTDADITAAMNRVYGPGLESGKLDPVLEAMQFASIPHEEW